MSRTMIFGDPAQFAVEAELESDPRFGQRQGSQILGRIRVWLNRRGVGDFHEPACWLGPPCDHLLEMRDRLDELWHPSLAGLTHDELFDRLDYLAFAARRGVSLSAAWGDAEWAARDNEDWGASDLVFLLHASEAFDGWKCFLLQPSADSLLALVYEHDQPWVQACRFPADAYRFAVNGFSAWLDQQQREVGR